MLRVYMVHWDKKTKESSRKFVCANSQGGCEMTFCYLQHGSKEKVCR